MKAVILAGGLGTRISEETHLKPKPMIEIGGKPILWHIMKLYSSHGVNDFVICCGYKGYFIKEYFANYFLHMSDVTFNMGNNQMEVHHQKAEPWRVTLVDTGDETLTGGRLRRVASFIQDEEAFCFTYGDGVADIDVTAQLRFHRAHGKWATVTAVQPPGRYGALQLDGARVTGFTEKPRGDGGLINGGFFVLSPKVLEFLEGDHTSWESTPLTELANRSQLMAFEHHGFWQPMDTLRDKNMLETLWDSGHAPMENLVNHPPGFWHGRSVLVTGHTGFKGGWLTLWLHHLGATVHGYALDPPTRPNLCEAAGIAALLASDTRADLADAARLHQAVRDAGPEVIFHLAAQPLVRASYLDPTGTFMSNVMGTAHLLEAARACETTRAVVVITTDKVYQNREWRHPYRESDPLGGHDPYSASKAAAEIVTAAYRNSFFASPGGHPARVATARAGNVIGGGDWAPDRIVPDCLRAFAAHQPVCIRFPDAVRPWQHVLEPLAGYLTLARELLGAGGDPFATAWNFGPAAADHATVGELAAHLAALWGSDAQVIHQPSDAHPHEAGLLSLDSSAARQQLGWTSRCGFQHALARTVEWHQQWLRGEDMLAATLRQIDAYQNMPAS